MGCVVSSNVVVIVNRFYSIQDDDWPLHAWIKNSSPIFYTWAFKIYSLKSQQSLLFSNHY